MFLTVYGTEWPILCWCAVKKLLTHSLTLRLQHLAPPPRLLLHLRSRKRTSCQTPLSHSCFLHSPHLQTRTITVSISNVCATYLNPYLAQQLIAMALLSFFFAEWVFSPALWPYMIGPVRKPDIQSLLEAFVTLKRGLQWSKARSS